MIPDKLLPGQSIGVIAPSDPVLSNQEDRLKEGRLSLEGMGFQVQFSQHLKSNSLGYTASAQEKAEDINGMFANPDIKAIICAQGGDTANAPLSLIDWALLRENPKIFMGLSDITVLLNAIYKQTGLVTFHGNDMLWGFGNNLDNYETSEFQRQLINGEIGPIPANRPRKTIRAGQAKGILLGGNLRCLLKLSGTPYWPDFTNAILFVETYEISAAACHMSFHQLLQMGVFDQIQGVVVGYIDSMQRGGYQGPQMADILLEATQKYDFPILKINDFGHNCPNTVIPVGGEAFLDAEQHILEIIAPCVKIS